MRALVLTPVLLLASSALYPASAIDAKTDVQTHGQQQKSTDENSDKTSIDQNSRSAGATSNFCWDVSNNMVRDKNQTNASGTSSANTDSTVGSSSKRAMGTGTARPAGMPDC
jgi:hypothetical protein